MKLDLADTHLAPLSAVGVLLSVSFMCLTFSCFSHCIILSSFVKSAAILPAVVHVCDWSDTANTTPFN